MEDPLKMDNFEIRVLRDEIFPVFPGFPIFPGPKITFLLFV